jgi:hypothetical protein
MQASSIEFTAVEANGRNGALQRKNRTRYSLGGRPCCK